MDAIQSDILRVIETCRAALAIPKRRRPSVDEATLSAATTILETLRSEMPDDEILAELVLEMPVHSWWIALFSMEIALRSIECREWGIQKEKRRASR
jgi:hypothetical protein